MLVLDKTPVIHTAAAKPIAEDIKPSGTKG